MSTNQQRRCAPSNCAPVNCDGNVRRRASANTHKRCNGRVPTNGPCANTMKSAVIVPPCRISNIDTMPSGNLQHFEGEACNNEESRMKCNAIVDAGADHTMLSKECCVCLANTGRKIQVGGPMSSWKKRDLRLIEAATAYNHPSKQTFIIKVQAIESTEGTLLLSSSQLRAMGCEVDDVAKCHGGQSRIVSNCGVGIP